MEMTDTEQSPTCEDKLAFDTKKAAEAAVLTVSWQRGTKLKVYQCRRCQLWHMTSSY